MLAEIRAKKPFNGQRACLTVYGARPRADPTAAVSPAVFAFSSEIKREFLNYLYRKIIIIEHRKVIIV